MNRVCVGTLCVMLIASGGASAEEDRLGAGWLIALRLADAYTTDRAQQLGLVEVNPIKWPLTRNPLGEPLIKNKTVRRVGLYGLDLGLGVLQSALIARHARKVGVDPARKTARIVIALDLAFLANNSIQIAIRW